MVLKFLNFQTDFFQWNFGTCFCWKKKSKSPSWKIVDPPSRTSEGSWSLCRLFGVAGFFQTTGKKWDLLFSGGVCMTVFLTKKKGMVFFTTGKKGGGAIFGWLLFLPKKNEIFIKTTKRFCALGCFEPILRGKILFASLFLRVVKLTAASGRSPLEGSFYWRKSQGHNGWLWLGLVNGPFRNIFTDFCCWKFSLNSPQRGECDHAKFELCRCDDPQMEKKDEFDCFSGFFLDIFLSKMEVSRNLFLRSMWKRSKNNIPIQGSTGKRNLTTAFKALRKGDESRSTPRSLT